MAGAGVAETAAGRVVVAVADRGHQCPGNGYDDAVEMVQHGTRIWSGSGDDAKGRPEPEHGDRSLQVMADHIADRETYPAVREPENVVPVAPTS